MSNHVEFPENVYYEDNSICILPLLLATSIKNTNLYSYNYDTNDNNSSSRKIDKKHIQDRIMTCNLLIENVKQYGFYEKYKELADYNYIRLHLNTIKYLLAEQQHIGRYEYLTAAKIQEEVTEMLPNKLFDELPPNDKEILIRPVTYLKNQQYRRQVSIVKKIFHSIRHNIVVILKKMIGMDPTKSIYNN